MDDITLRQLDRRDPAAAAEWRRLLEQEGIHEDPHLDYTAGAYDRHERLVATGSCFRNTLRCFAVSGEHQGEGLLNEIATHLIEVQMERGNSHLFLYTKVSSSKFFADLGFYEIARVEGTLVFMENRKNGFRDYIRHLEKARTGGLAAALVMNANPFTLGHQYLVEVAASRCDSLHLFIVSEDASVFPFSVRKELVKRGVAHLSNVICHDSGPYIISSATFPSYFLKDREAVILSHAKLDLEIFKKIAAALHITSRYVGEEPVSQVTGIYNQVMEKLLPQSGIVCTVVPRKEINSAPISASVVRRLIQEENFEAVRALVPETTYQYLVSEEAAPVIKQIKFSKRVIHY